MNLKKKLSIDIIKHLKQKFLKKISISAQIFLHLFKKKFNGKSIDTNTKKIGNLIKKQNFYKEVGKNSNLTNITHLDFKKLLNSCVKNKKIEKYL